MNSNNAAYSCVELPPLKKKKTRYLSSSSPIIYNDFIPDHIILNILKELPAKSLLRFRCISKKWRLMIDDPWFVDMHRIRSHNRFGGVKLLASQLKSIMWLGNREIHEQNLLLVDTEGKKMVLPHPMDGVILRSTSYGYGQAGVEGLLCYNNMIWNPTTRKKFDLPPQYPNIPLIYEGLNKPVLENYHYLGFYSLTKQYKVLSIFAGSVDGSKHGKKYKTHNQDIAFLRGIFRMQVITLEGTKSSWRDITHHIPLDAIKDMTLMVYPSNPSLYLNDEIYIVVGYPKYLSLLVFSVGQERFSFIHLPEGITHAEAKMWNLIEVRGCVALIKMNHCRIADAAGTEIWRLISTHNNAEVEWEKIIYPIWPTFLYHPKISNPEVHREPMVRCAINDTDNLVQTQDKTRNMYYCSYWDITQGKIKKAPKLQKILRHYYILSKHVETLFDPTLARIVSNSCTKI